MDIDPNVLGVRSEPCFTVLERGALKKFARALGETDPCYWDPEAARQQGYRDILALPTYAITLPTDAIPGMVLPEAGVIHGEQQFQYGEPMMAGDVIETVAWLADVKSRRSGRGRMTILTIEREGKNQTGAWVFSSRSVLVVTDAGAESPSGTEGKA